MRKIVNVFSYIALAILIFAFALISMFCLLFKFLKTVDEDWALTTVKRDILNAIVKILYGNSSSAMVYAKPTYPKVNHRLDYSFAYRKASNKEEIKPERICETCGKPVTVGYTDGDNSFYAHEGECFTKYMNNMYGEGCWHPTKDDETDAYGGYYVADPFDEPTGIYYTEWEEE